MGLRGSAWVCGDPHGSAGIRVGLRGTVRGEFFVALRGPWGFEVALQGSVGVHRDFEVGTRGSAGSPGTLRGPQVTFCV